MAHDLTASLIQKELQLGYVTPKSFTANIGKIEAA